MRRKTKIVLAITFMVAVLVTAFSYVYISALLRQRVTTARESAAQLTSNLAYLAANAAPDLSSTKVDTTNPQAMRRAVAYYLSTDRDLNNFLESVVGTWPIIYDAAIVNSDGKAILHTNPDLVGKEVPDRPDFHLVENANFRRQFRMVYNPPTVYDVRIPLQLDGARFGSIRVGVSTVFLKNELTPRLQQAVVFSSIAIFLSLLLAAGLSHIALGPLEQINRSLDSVTAGDADTVGEPEAEPRRVWDGESQDRPPGPPDARRQGNFFRPERQRRSDHGQPAGRPDAVHPRLARRPGQRVGGTLPGTAAAGAAGPRRPGDFLLRVGVRRTPVAVVCATQSHRSRGRSSSPAGNGCRFLSTSSAKKKPPSAPCSPCAMRSRSDASKTKSKCRAGFPPPAGSQKAWPMKSRTRSTPLCCTCSCCRESCARSILTPAATWTSSEAKYTDWTGWCRSWWISARPRDLHLEETDLRRLLEDGVQLAGPDASRHGVTIVSELPAQPLMVKVDTDFIKQAVLNVVLNGVQAMPDGGKLTVSARREDDMVVTEIRDQGGGIPADAQEKIFELYFTTKKDGSGIGLAQTYQILQWHYGSVDFESVEGEGTTFRLRLPLVQSRANALQETASRS